MKIRFSAGTLSVIRELIATVAALLIVVPPFLLGSGAIGWFFALLAEAAGIGLVFLFHWLEDVEQKSQDQDLFDARQAFLEYAHSRQYVLTPHRMSILRQRGASEDVVADLRPLLVYGGPIPGRDFLAMVRQHIGEQRFLDASRIIVETFDASSDPLTVHA
jgi:hypothetical protein